MIKKLSLSLLAGFLFVGNLYASGAQISGDQVIDGSLGNVDFSTETAKALDVTKIKDYHRLPWEETNGDLILDGTLSLDGNKISNMGAPSDSSDATTKGYVDGQISTVNTTISNNQVVNLQSADWLFSETPSGTVNGSNATFTLASAPVASKVLVFRNGLLQIEGGGEDYTISGTTITFVVAPGVGSKMRVVYIKP